MRNLAVILSLMLALSAPAIPAAMDEGAVDFAELDDETVSEMIEQAEAARARAAELDAEWLETRDLIGQARDAAGTGALEQAARLALRARQQADLAAEQALREAEAWQHRVVR